MAELESEIVIILVMLSVFSFLGAVGNGLVLYIYATKKEKSTSGLFIMTLAGTDFLTCVVIIPFTQANIILDYHLTYAVFCKLYMFFITCNVPFSAFIMVAIAVDRYFCICHPFMHAINIYRAKVIVLSLVFFACILGVITALTHSVYQLEASGNVIAAAIPSPNALVNESFVNGSSIFDLSTVNFNSSTSSTLPQSTWSTVNDTIENTTKSSSVTDIISVVETISEFTIRYTGLCIPSNITIGASFRETFQKVYAGFYAVSLIIVLILYGLIYKSIHEHRSKKRKRKRSSLYPSPLDFSVLETQCTAVTQTAAAVANSANAKPADKAELEPMRRRKSKGMSLKEKAFYANIRTAAMLFIVTVVFLLAFLPAWLMAVNAITFHVVIFYMYFVYNVANPFIYAFMNKSFRDDLIKCIKCKARQG